MLRPLAVAKACCTHINIPLDPVTARVMLNRMPRRRLHLCNYQERALGGIAAKSAVTLASQVGVSRRR